jgi:methyl-accepting chemotaxis protein-1 (serine sensor receptor)
MKLVMAPGIALLNRLTTPQRMVLCAAAFSAPIGACLYLLVSEAGAGWQDPAIIAIAAGLLAAYYFSLGHHLQVRSGFAGVREAINRFSAGDLGYNSPDRRLGEIGELLDQIQRMSSRLAGIFRQVRASADEINRAAREIAAGHVNLSQRTEQQASTLEETASGMEQLAGTVQQNADSCQLASGLSHNAEEVAQRGATIVRDVVERMAMIDRSSRRIADIIGVIEGIAFQTSILALNAAVEAARAGEQGRGFAVVAGEVRALAQRSTQAAKEIKALIDESAANVGQGGKLVGEAGSLINEIVRSVHEVTDLVRQIAAASRSQSTAVQEINKAIAQMEGVTQQNAALVEQAAASTLAFEEQAAALIEVTAWFKLGGAPAAPAARHVAPRRAAGSLPAAAAGAAKPRARIAARAEEDEWKEF